MTTYTKTTDFLAKDSLPLNNAGKYVKGSEIDTEFNNIATADADNLKVSALGTGIETALGVNTGSAGAPVLFNGAGGTPSSITLTNASGTAASLTAGVASAVAVGGITGLGTGVATALAVNVGSSGAPVVNGGALGTPSSGNLSNCTGFPTAIFSVGYDSGDQTITAAGSLTLAHSLGAAPKIVQCLLKCNDAGGDIGYANGDYVFVNMTGADAGSSAISTGVSVVPDATNLNIRFGSDTNVFYINNKSSGALQSITASKWKFIVRAYA